MDQFPYQHENEENDSLAELRDLLALLAAHELTAEQDARLQVLAVESDAAWQLYLEYMFMYATIHREQCKQIQASSTPEAESIEAENQDQPASSSSSIFPLLTIEKDLLSSVYDSGIEANRPFDSKENGSGGFGGGINFSFLPGLIMVVASTLILSTILIIPLYWSTHPDDSRWRGVARITKEIDCDWVQGEKCSKEGSLLCAGQVLELKRGLVEIEFSSGARVVLQGPARFVTSGKNDSRLDMGKLAAIVPVGAKGFKVCAPGTEVVDLGTEFGISVGSDNKVDVHVFKGLVEMEVETKSGKKETVRLAQNEAVEYEKLAGGIASIPVNHRKFVRDLSSQKGVTTDLKVVNPGFETPDIRTIPEFQPGDGDTIYRPIDGWKKSDPDQRSRMAMYQISPHAAARPVGPGATEGKQVAVIILGPKSLVVGKSRSNWIFQSLGVITPVDIGKTLRMRVDAGPRQSGDFKGLSTNGTISVGFAFNTTIEHPGDVVGEIDTFQQEKIDSLHELEATLPITVDLVGQELNIVLAVSDDGTIIRKGQYHFDNVRIVVEN